MRTHPLHRLAEIVAVLRQHRSLDAACRQNRRNDYESCSSRCRWQSRAMSRRGGSGPSSGLEREAFAHPDDAEGLFRSPAGPLAVAHALGAQFQIPYDYLRKTVLEYAGKWVEDLA